MFSSVKISQDCILHVEADMSIAENGNVKTSKELLNFFLFFTSWFLFLFGGTILIVHVLII